MKYHYEIDENECIYLEPTAKNMMLVNITPYLLQSAHIQIFRKLSKKLSSYLIRHPKILVSGGNHFEDMLLAKFKEYYLLCDAKYPTQTFRQVENLLSTEGALYYVVDVVVMQFASDSATAFTMRLVLYKVPDSPAREINTLLRRRIIDDLLEELCDTSIT